MLFFTVEVGNFKEITHLPLFMKENDSAFLSPSPALSR